MPAHKILVVEDEPLARNLFREVLSRDGYEVTEAADGDQALDLIRAQRFDLMISDLVMPKTDGLKLVQQVHSTYPRMPILFVTGYLSAIPGQAILQDMAEVITKPVDLDEFRSTVQRLLRSC